MCGKMCNEACSGGLVSQVRGLDDSPMRSYEFINP
jgi:hypothetical protein